MYVTRRQSWYGKYLSVVILADTGGTGAGQSFLSTVFLTIKPKLTVTVLTLANCIILQT